MISNNVNKEVAAWLDNFAPGYKSLSDEDKEEIKNFSLLWSLFENYVLNNNANASSIEKMVQELIDSKRLEIDEFKQQIEYFKKRYVENGKTNSIYNALKLRKNDNPELVSSMLINGNNNDPNILTAIIVIIYRIRNNFFHGQKWSYEFNNQKDNFINANIILMKLIELNNNAE